jgi:hypothetical protein
MPEIGLDRLEEVLSGIGKNVKEFLFIKSCIDAKIFELIPNITYLSLSDIKDDNFKIPLGFRLNLPKLRKLHIYSCSFKVLEFFDQLNDDILVELDLTYITGRPTRKYFENQRNIKNIRTDGNLNKLLNLQQLLKLEKVLAQEIDEPTFELLKGKDTITTFQFCYACYNPFKDLSGFKSLEVLKIAGYPRPECQIDVSSNLNLRKVKIFGDFPSMRSESVQELTIVSKKISNDSSARIASSFPNLRVLKVDGVNVKALSLHLPKLERLWCEWIWFLGSFDHQHLKYVCIKSENRYQVNYNIIAFAERCVNVESLKLFTKLPKKFVEKLLRSYPMLKALSFYGLAQDYIEVLKEFGGNLELFRCFDYDNPKVELEWVRNELKDQFYEFSIGNMFIAKKKGIGEKYGNFPEGINDEN